MDFMADSGPDRQPGKPGKLALCIKEGSQQGEAAKKQQETSQANKNVADSYVPGILNTLKRGKIK
jgi:hypothetical protein